MSMPVFLILTKHNRTDVKYRENFGQVRRYFPCNEGTQIEYLDGVMQKVVETPEQIDKLLEAKSTASLGNRAISEAKK